MNILPIFMKEKAVRHQSYFSQYAKEFEGMFSFQNDYILKAERKPDMQHVILPFAK